MKSEKQNSKKSFLTNVPQTGGPNGIPQGQNFITNLNGEKIMKKLMLVAAVVLGTAAMSFAQSQVAPQITIATTVITDLSVVSQQDMNFGNVGSNSGAVTLDPKNLHTQQQPGEFEVLGQKSTPVNISYSAPAALTDGTNTIPWTTTNLIGYNSNTVGSASSVINGSQVTLDVTSGNYYFWLGGTITLAASQAAGSYTSHFTLTVAY